MQNPATSTIPELLEAVERATDPLIPQFIFGLSIILAVGVIVFALGSVLERDIVQGVIAGAIAVAAVLTFFTVEPLSSDALRGVEAREKISAAVEKQFGITVTGLPRIVGKSFTVPAVVDGHRTEVKVTILGDEATASYGDDEKVLEPASR
ncbi:hypothetical protein ACFVAJ_17370 [Agromyces sp. NPDC057679]|uniref:hypothetical protein n=1 Tax=Agromyces sp. NPDC057679 TaxID=3346207 RepID=UPI0036733B9A